MWNVSGQGPFIRAINVMRIDVPGECAIALRDTSGPQRNTLIVGRGATDDEAAGEAVRRLVRLDAVDEIDWLAP